MEPIYRENLYPYLKRKFIPTTLFLVWSIFFTLLFIIDINLYSFGSWEGMMLIFLIVFWSIPLLLLFGLRRFEIYPNYFVPPERGIYKERMIPYTAIKNIEIKKKKGFIIRLTNGWPADFSGWGIDKRGVKEFEKYLKILGLWPKGENGV